MSVPALITFVILASAPLKIAYAGSAAAPVALIKPVEVLLIVPITPAVAPGQPVELYIDTA